MLTSAGVAAADEGTSSGTDTQASSNATRGGDDATTVKTAPKRDRKLGLKPHRDESETKPDATKPDATKPEADKPETDPDASDPDVEAPVVASPDPEPTTATDDPKTTGPTRKPVRSLFGGGKHARAGV